MSSKLFVQCAALACLVVAPALPAFAAVEFDDFCDVSSLTLNGSTSGLTPNLDCVLRLTDDFNQSGSAFLTQPFSLSSDASFSTFFCFRMSDPAGISDSDGPGADGLVFAVQTQADTAGGGGGGIGYGGVFPSMGVEFDTFQNMPDPNGNHVGIDLNGSVTSFVTAPIATRMNDGAVSCAWVDYNGAADTLEVRLSGTSSRPAVPLLSFSVDLPAVLGSTDAFVGFTSGTASASNVHEILSWRFDNCVSAPRANCRSALKSSLLLREDPDNDAKKKLLWKWIKGEATSLAEFGDPINSADYSFCLYAGTAATLWVEAQIPANAATWESIGAKGYKYKDPGATAAGIQTVIVKGSDDDRAKIVVKGKGEELPQSMPGALPLPVTVQLVNSDTDVCFEATYDLGDVVKSDAELFKAKAEP